METEKNKTVDKREKIYRNALILIEGQLYAEASAEFARIAGYKDASEKKRECDELAENKRKDEIYAEAELAASRSNERSLKKAIGFFSQIPGWRDADERIGEMNRKIEEVRLKERTDREEAIRAAREAERKKAARKKRIIRFVIAAACAAAVCAAGVILFVKFGVPAIRYNRSVKQIEAGEIDEAYRTLHGLNYRDSSDLVYDIAKNRLKDAEVGSTVLFGAYPQGRITSEKKDPVEWIVLDRDGSRMLLISKYALDAFPFMRYDYDPVVTVVSWQTSLLRNWLNDSFLQIAFDDGEIRMMQYTVIRDPLADGSPGPITSDRVFLLSFTEAMKYFPTDEDRKCVATQYALGYGAYRSSVGEACLWWLRTPTEDVEIMETADTDLSGYMGERVACVGTSGEIIKMGHAILNRSYAVRPVIWVDTESSAGLTLSNKN